MLKKILLTLLFMSFASPNLIFARHGGSSFAGGLAGGMLAGGLMSAAMQPRDKVVVVQEPQARGESQSDMEARIRREVELENRLRVLEEERLRLKEEIENLKLEK
ncbi:MAG: hypothetical protein ABIA74_05890 [bacterium]